MAKNSSDKAVGNGTRQTHNEQQENFAKSTQKALKLASEGEKYRYKSTCDKERFVDYLRSKLEMWEELKDKSFHATRMYNKTKGLLNVLE